MCQALCQIMEWNNYAALQGLKYLLSGPLENKFGDPWCVEETERWQC